MDIEDNNSYKRSLEQSLHEIIEAYFTDISTTEVIKNLYKPDYLAAAIAQWHAQEHISVIYVDSSYFLQRARVEVTYGRVLDALATYEHRSEDWLMLDRLAKTAVLAERDTDKREQAFGYGMTENWSDVLAFLSKQCEHYRITVMPETAYARLRVTLVLLDASEIYYFLLPHGRD